MNIIFRGGALKTITMVEFRRNAEEVLDLVRKGQEVLLTYRGRPAVVMQPASPASSKREDPFYRLAEAAEPSGGGTLTNQEMDELIYGR